MQASKSTIMALIGANYTQLKIPIYQRTYDWQKKHCEKLVNDIFNAMEHGKEHFTGTVVYINETNFAREKVSLIIDGQQRLTTVILILKGLEDLAIKYGHDALAEQIRDKFLETDTKNFTKTNKLIPTDEDQTNFDKLMANMFNEVDKTSSMFENYFIIKLQLERKLKNSEDLTNFFTTLIDQMTIVELVLDKDDDPQEIFESINSTGLELSQADLVRNYLLMSTKDQDRLYNLYWKPLYAKLKGEQLEEYLFNFLLLKLQKNIKYNEIYQNFLNYHESSDLDKEEVLSTLLDVSNIYNSFITNNKRYSEEINELLSSFTELGQSTIFPFLLRVFIDFENGGISEMELLNVLKLFRSYHIRRMIVNAPSGTLRGLYINLYNRIFKVENNKERYYDSIAFFMSQFKTKDEIPSNHYVLTSLDKFSIYKQPSLAKYVLTTLENKASAEKLLVGDLTIEHLMPQTLNQSWRNMLGVNYEEIHEEYLHTLGNLTITGYNSQLGNKPFNEKKEIISTNSKATYLNSDILASQEWTLPNIQKRTYRLATDLLHDIQIPTFNSEGLRFENVEEFDLNYKYDEVKGRKPYSFKFLDMEKEIPVKTFKQILIETIQILDLIDSNKMDAIAENIFNPWDGARDKISNDSNLNKELASKEGFEKIRDNLYLVGGFSSAGVIESVRKLMMLAYK